MRTKIVFVSGSRADFGLIQDTLRVFSDSKLYSVTLVRIGHSLAEENDCGNQISGLDHGIPSNEKSVIGQSNFVGKNALLWNGKSSRMWKGQAHIANAIFLLNLLTIAIQINALTKLCDIS